MLLALLLFVLLAAAPGWAQNVTQTVWSNRTPTSGTSDPLRNIGQSQHLLSVRYADAPPNVCAYPPSVPVFLEASYDGTNFFAITPTLINMSGQFGQASANGSYPIIRVRSTISRFGCSITVHYSGSMVAAPFPQTQTAQASGYLVGQVSVASTAGQTLAFVANAANAAARIVVYGFWLSNTTGTARTAQLFYGDPDCSTLPAATVALVNLPASPGAGSTVVAPTSLVPYYSGPLGSDLCVALDGAGGAYATAVYRME